MLTLLKLVHNTEGKVIHPMQARHTVKVELPQFADNMQQDLHEFLIANLPVLPLPRYQESISSVLQCKSYKYQSIKKEVFSCIEVPVPERGVASLENCLDRWLTVDEVQDWKCTSCSKHGSGVKKLVVRKIRKIESSVEKIYKRVKFPMGKTVIGGKKYEMKGVIYHSGSPMSGHYTAALKLKERWWSCNDAVVKVMEEGKVVSEAAYILFYKQM